MSPVDDRVEQLCREQRELIRAHQRQEAMAREATELTRLKPLLATDIDAAWGRAPKGR